MWSPGDDLIGDPPHERQGWYSIYNTDLTTHDVIKKYTNLMNSLRVTIDVIDGAG
jgi:mannan endo-1,4-beta-mannosidase